MLYVGVSDMFGCHLRFINIHSANIARAATRRRVATSLYKPIYSSVRVTPCPKQAAHALTTHLIRRVQFHPAGLVNPGVGHDGWRRLFVHLAAAPLAQQASRCSPPASGACKPISSPPARDTCATSRRLCSFIPSALSALGCMSGRRRLCVLSPRPR